MRLIACGASVAGPRHLESGESNQDAMVLSGGHCGCIAAVADGLGSKAHSDVGARRACQVSRRFLRAMSCDIGKGEMSALIHEQWIEAIKPITPSDAATTLLFCRVTAKGDVYAAQLGDGLLLIRSAGEFQCVTPERDAFGNQTWALGTEAELDRWNSTKSQLTKPGDGVVLLTDGVADDLEPAHLGEFFDALYQKLSKRNRRRGRRWLQAELNDWGTPMHSDDKTLVALFRASK